MSHFPACWHRGYYKRHTLDQSTSSRYSVNQVRSYLLANDPSSERPAGVAGVAGVTDDEELNDEDEELASLPEGMLEGTFAASAHRSQRPERTAPPSRCSPIAVDTASASPRGGPGLGLDGNTYPPCNASTCASAPPSGPINKWLPLSISSHAARSALLDRDVYGWEEARDIEAVVRRSGVGAELMATTKAVHCE